MTNNSEEHPWYGTAFARIEFNYITWEAQAAELARACMVRRDYIQAARHLLDAARHQQGLIAIRETMREVKNEEASQAARNKSVVG